MKSENSLEELKRILYDYYTTNKFLSMIFSNRKIRKNIDDNIKDIFIRNKRNSVSGEYNFLRKWIILYFGSDLTIKDIASTKLGIGTILHEGVHAIFRHKRGTGLFCINKHNKNAHTNYFSEIGRGLNEGITEWIVEQNGVKDLAYLNLTQIVRIIENSIGFKKMKVFLSSNYRNIFKTLNMTKDEGIVFLRQLDEIYFSEEKMLDISNVSSYFKRLLENTKTGDEEELIRLKKDYADIKDLPVFKLVFTKRKKELQKIMENPLLTDESKKIVLQTAVKDIIQELAQLGGDEKERRNFLIVSSVDKILESLIIDRLDNPQTEDYVRLIEIFKKVRHLFSMNDITIRSENFIEFEKRILKIYDTILKQVYEDTFKDMKDGMISLSVLKNQLKRLKMLYGNTRGEESKILQYISEITQFNGHIQEQRIIIEFAIKNNCLDDLPQLSTRSTKSGKYLVFKDNEIVGLIDSNTNRDRYITLDETIKVGRNENYADYDNRMHWTLIPKTNIPKLVRRFEEIRAKEQAENANVEIYILRGLIAFKSKEGYRFYDIFEGEDSRIEPADFKDKEYIKSMIKERRTFSKELNLTIKSKEAIKTKIIMILDRIKKYFIREKNEDSSIVAIDSKSNQPSMKQRLRQNYLSNKWKSDVIRNENLKSRKKEQKRDERS